MLPQQLLEEVAALKFRNPNSEVVAKIITIRGQNFGSAGFEEETEAKVTNVVLGLRGIEILCEPL